MWGSRGRNNLERLIKPKNRIFQDPKKDSIAGHLDYSEVRAKLGYYRRTVYEKQIAKLWRFKSTTQRREK